MIKQKNTSLSQIPTSVLTGVGPKMVERLAKLGIDNIQDLLFHLPSRYEDRTKIYYIANLMMGMHVSVQGEIEANNIILGRKRMMVCTLNDGTGKINLRFFNYTNIQKQKLSRGKIVKCFGEIKRGQQMFEIHHPECTFLEEYEETKPVENLTPVYPTTEGLKQITLRNMTEQALSYLEKGMLTELLPPGIYQGQMTLTQAVETVHRPPSDTQTIQFEQGSHPAQQRLILEELLAHNLSLLKVKSSTKVHPALSMQVDNTIEKKFLGQLAFQPTGAQTRVIKDIRQDLAKQTPMMRLVQGDVGSGKTLVAALAAITAISNGYQVALMAPTELLAEQHAISFKQWFDPLEISVTWLAGKTKGKARETTLEHIKSGAAQMVVGTHAIFQNAVEFNHLTLIIIDEQHRFGVHQRLELREKGIKAGKYPHQLVMTATPIPRTLAMTAYADLDVSIIDELPPGRTPIKTVALPDTRRAELIENVKRTCCDDKRQVYWVCTLIEESEVLQCQAAEDTEQELIQLLPELKIGMVHGRMKPAEKQQVMDQFKSGDIDLLVATTVIEVGVNVPNASLMVIENPERLGLAQLHQLRGRVGRGDVESHCVLLYRPPLSKTGKKRLGVLRESSDGFFIAQRDLEIRGPGEVLGTKQTGLADLKIADLVRDSALIPQIQQIAHHIFEQYPQNSQAIIDRWIGDREIYIKA